MAFIITQTHGAYSLTTDPSKNSTKSAEDVKAVLIVFRVKVSNYMPWTCRSDVSNDKHESIGRLLKFYGQYFVCVGKLLKSAVVLRQMVESTITQQTC